MDQSLPQNYSIALPLNNSSIIIRDVEGNSDTNTFVVTHNTHPIRILIQDNFDYYDN